MKPDSPEHASNDTDVPSDHLDAGGKFNDVGSAGRESTAAVEPALDELDERIRTYVGAWIEEVRAKAIRELFEIFDGAAGRCEHLRDELGDPSAETLSQYRERVRDDIVTPLQQQLSELNVANRIEAARNRLVDRLTLLASASAEVIERPEPETLYMPDPSDSLRHRLGKARVRWRRGLQRAAWTTSNVTKRLLRRPIEAPPPHTQEIPLRRLVLFHVGGRVPEIVAHAHENVHQLIAQAIADAARSVTVFGHDLLRAELAARSEDAVEDAPSGFVDGLGESLRKSAFNLDVDAVLSNADAAVEASSEQLRLDVQHAGTFMLDLSSRPVKTGVKHPATARAESWRSWHAHVQSRIRLMNKLFGLRERTLEFEASTTERVAERGVAPARLVLGESEATLRELSARASSLFDSSDPAILRGDIEGILEDALRAVDQDVLRLLRDGDVQKQILSAGESAAANLAASIEAVPERLELNVLRPENLKRVDPQEDSRTVDLREHVSAAYDAILIERLLRAIQAVVDAIGEVRTEAEEIPGILRFNLEAALDELQAAEPGGSHAEAPYELVAGGLDRSADLLRDLSQKLSDELLPFETRIREVFDRGFANLHDRIRIEERFRGQILDLRTGGRERMRHVVSSAAEQARRGRVIAQRALRRGVRSGRILVRKGQAAAGLAEATQEERLETVEALASINQLIENLPLVYRRLFSFTPLKDPSLLEGRERDLVFVRNHIRQWKRGLSDTLVLTGPPGGGLTSFLNTLRHTEVQDATSCTLELRERIRTEDELVRRLNAVLKLGDGATTLDGIAEILTASPHESGTRICFVEHLEHLYLREIGGTELIESFLTFMSRTDSHVLWIATMSGYGWKVVATAEPAAAGLAFPHALTPISRPALEALVLNRHRRSGVPLRFESPPSDTNPLLARRLRRAKTEAEKQEILRAYYFDRLFRTTGQNIMLALLYWLRSVEMKEDEGVMLVRLVQPLSFSLLQTFDLQRIFTLKALLEHASLTIEEHSEVFQIPREASLQIFETLGNLLLIEPLTKDGAASRFAFGTIETGVRYRVRTLLIHPIELLLRGKNILH